jgi:hypothetical protein
MSLFVSDNFTRPNSIALNGNWDAVVPFNTSAWGSAGGLQILNNAFAGLSSGGGAAMSIYPGTFGNNQYAQATISAIAAFTSVVSITACSASAGTSTYTYTLVSGASLQLRQQVYISGMTNSGNNSGSNGFFITALGAGTFSVANASPGANESGSTGTGKSPSDSNVGLVVRGTADGKNGYVAFIGTNSGYVGAGSQASADTRVYDVELWKVVAGTTTFITSVTQPITSIPDSVNDVYVLSAVGTSIAIYKNGVSIVSASDSALSSGNPGIMSWTVGGVGEWANPTTYAVGNSGQQMTDFSASDYGVSAIQNHVTAFANATSISGTFSSPNVAGDTLVALVFSNGAAAIPTISDTAGNTNWVLVDSAHGWGTGGNTNFAVAIFVCTNCKAMTGNVVTVHTNAASGNVDLIIAEYPQSVIDKHGITTGNSAAPLSPAVTTTSANEIIIGYTTLTAGGGSVAGSLASVATDINFSLLADQRVAAVGTYKAPFTSTSAGWAAGIITLTLTQAYSVPDCRNSTCGLVPTTHVYPNGSRTVQGTLIYDQETSNNSTVPSTDSRTAGAPVDSRVASIIPQNSRTPGTFGPGE